MSLTADDLRAVEQIIERVVRKAITDQLPPITTVSVTKTVQPMVDSLALDAGAGFYEVHERLDDVWVEINQLHHELDHASLHDHVYQATV